jgi:glycosyltransferase involved in cell wall biosynthesis
MNILFVADVSIANVIGGAERVLFEQSTRLVQRGHDVHILTRRLGHHKKDQDTIQGVREWRYGAGIQKNTVSLIWETRRNSRKLFEFLHKEFNIDLINIYQPFSGFGVTQSPLSNSIKKIYTCFSFSFEEFISRNLQPGKLVRKSLYLLNIILRKWTEKRVLKSCDEIVVLSQFTQEKLADTYQIPLQKVSIIPGGIDLHKFRPTSDKLVIRNQLQIPSDKTVLFTVRNLVPRMGLENLIRALICVVQQAPDIYLVLGGDGPLKTDLMALAKKCRLEDVIDFTGFIPEARLSEFYRMADIFVLPTRELEGFGLVTLEAMASGIPVLGTPVGGTKEILGKFDSSFLFKDTTPECMATLILQNYKKIKERPEEWIKIANHCRRFVETHYSWNKNIDAMEELFNRTTATNTAKVQNN